MAHTTADLISARKAKNDDFYTQLSDINNELSHYKDHFKGKVVFCNCDDPFESNFFKYFALNFNFLGLKKLIATGYATSPIVGTQLPLLKIKGFEKEQHPRAYKMEINKVYDVNNDGATNILDVEELVKQNNENKITLLKGDGDFRSDESIKLLKEADIVCTNPPFSLFREYVAQLMEYKKDFLIIGNMNAISYKEFFPYIQGNKVWTGYKSFSGGMNMIFPKDSFDPSKVKKYTIDENGNYIVNIMGVIRYTNLDTKKRHEEYISYKKYSSEEYPKYDNYDAINVDKAIEIPMDYKGIMGVPITFLDKYNPDQFEIIGLDRYTVPKEFLVGGRVAIDGKPKYARILIKWKNL